MQNFPQPLIDVDSLAARIGTPEVVVVDCRFDLARPDQGHADYLEAHVPGAVYAHLDDDLSGPRGRSGGRHPLPTPAAMAERFADLGISADSKVVAYDQAGGAIASRLWWMLRYMGHPAVAVLDGGFGAWLAGGQPTESGNITPRRGRFQGAPRDDRLVSAEAVPTLPLLVDSRDGARYRGEHEPLDPVAGHIPGARHRFFADNLERDGRFREPAELRADFERLLAACPADEAVFYCGSGVTACQNLLAMVHAGLPMARLYAGSWSDWCSDPSRAVARGPTPSGDGR